MIYLWTLTLELKNADNYNTLTNGKEILLLILGLTTTDFSSHLQYIITRASEGKPESLNASRLGHKRGSWSQPFTA